jgi:hypothetical protein
MNKKTRKVETIADRPINSTWTGRSLDNYIAMHPKAAGARSLTEARQKAFGEKQPKVGVCQCGQPGCQRYRGGGKGLSHC